MGLLEKLIREGFWDDSRRPEFRIDVSKITQENLDELLEIRRTVVSQNGRRFAISIPEDKHPSELRQGDFQVIDLP
jgi:hypothetical protein